MQRKLYKKHKQTNAGKRPTVSWKERRRRRGRKDEEGKTIGERKIKGNNKFLRGNSNTCTNSSNISRGALREGSLRGNVEVQEVVQRVGIFVNH